MTLGKVQINSFNVTLVNQLLRLDDVTVTLQWLQEPRAVYHFNVLPDTAHTELTRIMSLDSITVNLTLFRNIQYNVSIVSSLCSVISSKILHYGKCKRSMIIDTTKVLIDYTHNYYTMHRQLSIVLLITLYTVIINRYIMFMPCS